MSLSHTLFDCATALLHPLYKLTGGYEGKYNSPPKKILIVKPDHLGDVILTTPSLAALHDHFPEAEIWYLVKNTSLPALKNNPALTRLIEFNAPWCCRSHEKALPWNELSKLARQLRRQRFDVAIAMQDNAQTHLFLSLCGIPRRIGFAPRGGKYLLTDAPIPPTEDEHAVLSHNRLVKLLGVEVGERPTQIFLTKEEEEEGAELLGSSALLFHVGAAHKGKRVSVEQGAAICQALNEKCDLQVFLASGPGEKELLAQYKAAWPEAKTLPPLTIRQLAAVIKKAKLFLGHDSGPGHIASAVGTPTIILFGQGNPKKWRPWGKKTTIIRKEVCETPCIGQPQHDDCKNIGAIEPKEVAETAYSLLSDADKE